MEVDYMDEFLYNINAVLMLDRHIRPKLHVWPCKLPPHCKHIDGLWVLW